MMKPPALRSIRFALLLPSVAIPCHAATSTDARSRYLHISFIQTPDGQPAALSELEVQATSIGQ
jgi:hypothetical protein